MFRAKRIAFSCLTLLFLTVRTNPQEDPRQTLHFGVVESVRTLLHPATRIEFFPEEVQFQASRLRYTYFPSQRRWEVKATSESDGHVAGWGMVEGVNEIVTPSGKLTISRVGPGELTLHWLACSQAIGPVRLWTAAGLGRVWLEQMRVLTHEPALSSDRLTTLMSISEPEVMGWDEDERNLWLGIGFYAGEWSGGIGTVVQLDKVACKVQVHQPPALAISSIMSLKLWKRDLWLATGDFGESGWGSRMGVVRYDIRTRQVRPFARNHPLAEAYITAMARQGSTLWLGTPGRFFALNMDSRALQVWRIVPKLELKASSPVRSRPGGEARGSLASGVYEVRWVGAGFAEVLTPDCAEGYAQTEWINNPRSRGSPDLMDVAASDKWGVASFRIYRGAPEPGPLPSSNGWFFRVPAEPVAPPNGEWQRARVCAGWVEARPEDVRLTVEKVR